MVNYFCVRNNYRSVYIAFDQHPSFKGASTHIAHMCKVLSASYGPTLLLTVEGPLPPIQNESIDQLCFTSDEPSILKRALLFSAWVKNILHQQDALLLAHFRDVWGAMAVLDFPHLLPIFEVNGLSSIEWPHRYPQLSNATLQKLRKIELFCLQQSALVLTPSNTILQHIVNQGIDINKIKVLPNGADVPFKRSSTPLIEGQYILYFGALQPWQGVDILLKSLRYLDDKHDLRLVICASHTEHQCKAYRKLAEKLGVHQRIVWYYQLDREALTNVIEHALLSVAPLTECSRNIEQGCSPLKIFESMALGTPVLASDLPVVREIITNKKDGILVRPGRPAELARAIRIATDYPESPLQLGQQARQTILDHFTWSKIENELTFYYEQAYAFSFGYSTNRHRYG